MSAQLKNPESVFLDKLLKNAVSCLIQFYLRKHEVLQDIHKFVVYLAYVPEMTTDFLHFVFAVLEKRQEEHLLVSAALLVCAA